MTSVTNCKWYRTAPYCGYSCYVFSVVLWLMTNCKWYRTAPYCGYSCYVFSVVLWLVTNCKWYGTAPYCRYSCALIIMCLLWLQWLTVNGTALPPIADTAVTGKMSTAPMARSSIVAAWFRRPVLLALGMIVGQDVRSIVVMRRRLMLSAKRLDHGLVSTVMMAATTTTATAATSCYYWIGSFVFNSIGTHEILVLLLKVISFLSFWQ